MDKKNAKLIFIGLILFTAITWMGVVKGQVDAAIEYKKCIEKAANLEEKEIYIDAVDYYEKALKMKPKKQELLLKVADMYYKLGDVTGFLDTCDRYIAASPESPEPYLTKANYYMDREQYSKAIGVVNAALQEIDNNKEINALKKTLSVKGIEKHVGYTEIKDWHIQEGANYITVQGDGLWGLAKKNGGKAMKPQYEDLGAYDIETGVIPCSFNGEYYYINIDGYRKLVGDEPYEYLGSFGDGLAPAKRKGKCGYINTEFEEYKFEFNYTGAFANGVAAVQKGGKWALINEKLKGITKFEYDEILVDSYGFCAMFERVIARKGNSYMILNLDGKQIGKETFEGATLPAETDAYIAVKKNGKWGFADKKGKVVIEPKFDNAKSFALGLAPACIDSRWGYIDKTGNFVIDQKYLDAGVFSQAGSAPVKNAATWNFLVLCEYDN